MNGIHADALYGRAAACKAKGYKLYSIIDAACGAVDQWLIGPMNWSEQKAAMILLERIAGPAVIVGDGEYDTSPLYDMAACRDLALLAPAPKKAQGTGHRYISPHRRDGLALAHSTAGSELLMARVGIERSFAHMTACSCGLASLPAWVRRPHRVGVWVAAKMLIDLDRRMRLTVQKPILSGTFLNRTLTCAMGLDVSHLWHVASGSEFEDGSAGV